MTKTAWVFPGQGSQAIGMGIDLLDLSAAKVKFQQAEEILGWSISEICQGEEEKLSRTLYTQPCLYVVESILVDLMRQQGRQPDLVAGHSLGEYVALYAAGVFDFESGLRLVKQRAELMARVTGGMMIAVMGFNREKLENAIAQSPDVVLANDNSDGQVVISGTPAATQAVIAQLKPKRSVILNVSGAFHSPFMATAAAEYEKLLASVPFADAQVPVLSNVEPLPAVNADVLKEQIKRQMTGSVRWREICQQLPVENISKVVEVGPGKVLTGLIKRSHPDIKLENVSNAADLQLATSYAAN
ncbi:MAG: ACP S-malonyltransferase [Crinalium sp.]